MLYYVAALWIAAIVLLANQPRQEVNRWAAFFLFSSGVGGLTALLEPDGFIPVPFEPIIQCFNHTMSPYGVLVFCIVYARQQIDPVKLRYFKLGLLLPPLITVVQVIVSPDHRIDFGLLLVWTAPYYFISCYLLIRAYVQEMNPNRRRSLLITATIMVPTLLGVMLLINVGSLLYPGYDFFQYVSLLIVYSFVVGLICVFVYGVLGMRLKVERDPMDRTMQAVSTGTSMLNHTIKNEIGKIALSTENVKQMLQPSQGAALEQLGIITQASEHLLAMTERIQQQTKELVLKEQPVRLDHLIEELLQREQEMLRSHGIEVKLHIRQRPWLLLDPVHVTEAAGNLLRNAVEATSGAGMIELTVDAGRRGAVVSVKDYGDGIPDGLQARVFEPFYSTKKDRRSNYGLGLSYAYHVMKKSGGSIGLESRQGEGTIASLYFPRRVLVRLAGRGEE
ncbi:MULTISPECIES: sensor histidine kinase [Paenibacillus]|uniref:sensor histidine kinase n=1 Tax=Paenibacillus TaxID=44249 RepID=UPI00048BC70E|nr:sensor histidine kinase [Paenibacillus sp. IHBB 10380]